MDSHRSQRHARPVVQSVKLFNRKTLEQTLFQHHTSAAVLFLRGLKDQEERAAKIVAPGQIAGGAQQHRRMSVVAAGVHPAGSR